MQNIKYKFGRGTPVNCLSSNDQLAIGRNDVRPLFNFSINRPTNSVSVENIPDHVSRQEIVALFNNLIGEVRGFQHVRDKTGSRLDITFFDHDAATKAMCMNGYTIAGVPLSVSMLAISPSFNTPIKQSKDDRRNLYVLGLPFALTKNEFVSIFSHYGTVSHCVILATVDNSSRRRGFVVMSSHEEAILAMTSLTNTAIRGHTIDVSWAVVQRSQGFLDGGDRSLLLDSRSHIDSHDADPASLVTVPSPTPSLLAVNLPTLLFSQAQDLYPLFFPFGHIEKLEIVQVTPLGTMSVLVHYSEAPMAQEAKESLTGQLYGSHRIEVRYVQPSASTALHHGQFLGGGNTLTKRASTSMVQRENSADTVGNFARPIFHTYSGSKENRPATHQELSSNLLSHLGFASNTQSNKSTLSATPSPFSAVFNDLNVASTSAASRWNLVSNHSRLPHAFSSQYHFNNVYPNSAA